MVSLESRERFEQSIAAVEGLRTTYRVETEEEIAERERG